MKYFPRLVVVLLLIATIGCGGSSKNSPKTGNEGQSCLEDLTCNEGLACLQGICSIIVDVGCSSDGDCLAGEKCVNQFCLPLDPQPSKQKCLFSDTTECGALNQDCYADKTCNEGLKCEVFSCNGGLCGSICEELTPDDPAYIIKFKDPNLEKAVKKALTIDESSGVTIKECEALIQLEHDGFQLQEGEKIGSIEGLEHCTNLEVLNLRNNALNDVSLLSHLNNIKLLDLSGNQIEEIAEETFLNNYILDSIYLKDNPLKSILFMDNILNELVNFSATGTNLDAQSLELYILPILSPEIVHLEISSFQINEIDFITEFKLLEHFTCSDCSINNLPGKTDLAALTKLKILRLQKNNISNIDPITELQSIEEIDLSYNQFKDIKALTEAKWLSQGDYIGLFGMKEILYKAAGLENSLYFLFLKGSGVEIGM